MLKFWKNLYRYINISVPEFLEGRIFLVRTGPLKENERPILYRPFYKYLLNALVYIMYNLIRHLLMNLSQSADRRTHFRASERVKKQ